MSTALDIAPAEPSTLPLADIKIDADLQCRANGISTRTVNEYAEAMRNGASFPPVVVFKDAKSLLWLADGFQRCAARALAFPDAPEILVDLREGSRKDALIFAAGSNSEHGLRRSNADKKRSVTLMLAAFPKWSDWRISEACGVGNKFVGDVRRVVCPEHSSDEREGLDGKLRVASPNGTGLKPSADSDHKFAQLVNKFRKLLGEVSEQDRARFQDQILEILGAQ